MGTTMAPDKILRELADLWASLGKQEAEGGAGVLRACSTTLVVLAEESEDMASLGETIAALMPEHPARTIVIRLRGGGDRELAERVYAQCWMPFGQRRQICCEQIEITASDAALGDLPPVVLPLVAPDLPVIVWCRSMRLFEMPVFGAIAAMAHKVVLDSGRLADAKAALVRMADAVRGGLLLGDLSWTRLTRWREMLSRVFENRQHLAQLTRIARVRVGFEGEAASVQAWYMGAWAANALAEAGAQAKLELEPEAGGEGRLLRVELEGEAFRVGLARREEKLVITVGALSTCANLAAPTDYLLMREELGILRPDAVFERTLASAARLAYATNR